MEQFKDYYGTTIRLSFKINSFSERPTHVLVICRYNKSWLLTSHRNRGLEFPGGKVEEGETLEEAAYREVYEETGGKLKRLIQIGEYKVAESNQSFVKALFYGDVEELEDRSSYFETNGPVIKTGDILNERFTSDYSFIMKDDVIYHAVKRISQLEEQGIV